MLKIRCNIDIWTFHVWLRNLDHECSKKNKLAYLSRYADALFHSSWNCKLLQEVNGALLGEGIMYLPLWNLKTLLFILCSNYFITVKFIFTISQIYIYIPSIIKSVLTNVKLLHCPSVILNLTCFEYLYILDTLNTKLLMMNLILFFTMPAINLSSKLYIIWFYNYSWM